MASVAFAQADFQVDVNLVVLYVTVQDHEGHFVSDLMQDAFQVTENGQRQRITLFSREDAPVAVGLVVDNSGSMRRKLTHVVAAASEFAHSTNPEDDMFIVNFNENVSLGLPAGEAFVSDPKKLSTALSEIHARGQTALNDAVITALQHVHQSPLQKKVLVVLSDGGDNASKSGFPQVLKLLQESEVIVYTVGLFDEYDKDRNPGVLKQMAKVSGGEAFFPDDISDVTEVLQSISRDIRNQYTIGYAPSNATPDGPFRSVSVKLTIPHANRYTVRTRTGYRASKDGEPR